MVSKSQSPSFALYSASFVALFQIAQVVLDLDALQAGGQAAAHQFHQEVHLHFPVLPWTRAGDPEQAGGPAFDEIADDQHRSDTEMTPHRRVIALIASRFGSIAQLRHTQRRQARLQPGKGVQRLASQLFRITGGEHAAGNLDLCELPGLRLEGDVEGSIRAGSPRAAVPNWRR